MQSLVFKIALHWVSPMIWRRLCVSTDISLVELHQIIQTAMDWDQEHYSFHIYGRDFGLPPADNMCVSDDPHEVLLRDFEFVTGDRFTYN